MSVDSEGVNTRVNLVQSTPYYAVLHLYYACITPHFHLKGSIRKLLGHKGYYYYVYYGVIPDFSVQSTTRVFTLSA